MNAFEILEQVASAVRKLAYSEGACFDFVALTQAELDGLKELCAYRAGPSDTPRNELLGLPVVIAGSPAHQMRLAQGQRGYEPGAAKDAQGGLL